MAKLTQKALEAIKPEQAGVVIRDEGGLWGKVRGGADGLSISFYYRCRVDGKHKDISCGTWPLATLAAIRAVRDETRQRVKRGLDPAAQKKIGKQEQREAEITRLAEIERRRTENLTLQEMFDAWTTDGVRRKDGNAELQRSFSANVLPKLGKRLVKDVTEGDLQRVLRAMVERGVNRAAVVLRNDLMQMFSWAEKRQPWRKLLVDGNPMSLIEIEKIVAPGFDLHRARDRILSEVEIQELHDIFSRMHSEYDAAPNKRVAPQPVERTTQIAVWIMLSTMCRVGEMSMARWEDVDLNAGEWRIPRENVKGSTAELKVYLSDFAIDKFKQLHMHTGHSKWCFPARNKPGHICVKSISKQIGDRQVRFKKRNDGTSRKPLAHRKNDDTLVLADGKYGAWTPHDLRRTGATMMQALGITPDIIDRCQNHVLAGSKVRRAYQHHDYRDEKRHAWNLLGERLSLLLDPPSNVRLFLHHP